MEVILHGFDTESDTFNITRCHLILGGIKIWSSAALKSYSYSVKLYLQDKSLPHLYSLLLIQHWNIHESHRSHDASHLPIYHNSMLEFNKQRTLEEHKYENGLISDLQNRVLASSGQEHLQRSE